MSLDDERTNWKHYEQLERGVLPEVTAASRVASIIGKYLDGRVPDALMQQVGSKVVANRHPIRVIFDEVDADPKRLREPRSELRQDPVADLSDLDWALENEAFYLRGLEAARAMTAQIRAAQRWAEYDPDAREVDREDDRLREQRQDEAAREAAPRGIAS